jgi:type VI secretion system protein ImpH
MVTDGRGQAPSIEEQIFTEGRLFDFFRAVEILEALYGSVSVGEGPTASREAVRFASSVRMSFPPSAIASVERPSPSATRQAPVMTVNFMGLAGAHGPLPAPFAELVLQRAARGDTAARDFLDIFNHRLVSLVYRIRKRHRVGLGARSPEADDTARYLYALTGLGTARQREQLTSVRDRTLLYYAGLLAREARTMAGLSAMLTSHFGVPIEGVPFTGGFYPVEPEDRTSIGRFGRNRRLGRDASLGARYWDQEAAFELRVGPLEIADFLRFLPTGRDGVMAGDRLAPLCELARFYAGPVLDVRVRLVLDPEAVAREPRARHRARPTRPRLQTLGERPRLGYTAWVGRAWQRRDVVLSGAALRAQPRA